MNAPDMARIKALAPISILDFIIVYIAFVNQKAIKTFVYK
jgi:hypothetical protein